MKKLLLTSVGLCTLSLTIKLIIKFCRAELYILCVNTKLATGYLLVFVSVLKKESTKKDTLCSG